MALVAREIINAARDHHPEFLRNDYSNVMLLRALSRAQTALYQAAFSENEEALATSKQFPRATVEAAVKTGTGMSLPAHVLILGVVVRKTDGHSCKMQLVPYTDLLSMEEKKAFPAGALVGQRLHPVASDDWADVKNVSVRYVPMPEKLETLDQELTIPDTAENAVVLALVVFMAQRGNLLSSLPGIVESAGAAQQAWVNMVAEQDTTSSWTVKRVY